MFWLCFSVSNWNWSDSFLTLSGRLCTVQCYSNSIQIRMCTRRSHTPAAFQPLSEFHPPGAQWADSLHCWRIVWHSCCSLTLFTRISDSWVIRLLHALDHEPKNVPAGTPSVGMLKQSFKQNHILLFSLFTVCVVMQLTVKCLQSVILFIKWLQTLKL